MRPDAARRLDAVVAAVCSLLEVSRRDLLGRSRMRHLAQARQLAMFFACECLGLSVSVVARYFKRDRATVYHAVDVSTRRCWPQGHNIQAQAPHRDLRAALTHLKREFCIMPKSDPAVNLLEALRNIVRLRQRQLAVANQQGTMPQETAMLESRQLTALVKRLEAVELGEPLELGRPYQFPDEVLADYAQTHILRLIGESRHLMAQALAEVAERLGLGAPPPGLSQASTQEADTEADTEQKGDAH